MILDMVNDQFWDVAGLLSSLFFHSWTKQACNQLWVKWGSLLFGKACLVRSDIVEVVLLIH